MLDVQSETAEQAESHLGHQRGSPGILRLLSKAHSLSVSGWKRVARRQETPVKVQLSLGHPSLMLLYSLSLLAFWAAIGIRFGATWGALQIAAVGHPDGGALQIVAIARFFKAARLTVAS